LLNAAGARSGNGGSMTHSPQAGGGGTDPRQGSPRRCRMVLGHSIKGIQAVYDPRAEYQSIIDAAIARVAAQIERIINPTSANVVVPLGSRS
jgi:hypothetical protein